MNRQRSGFGLYAAFMVIIVLAMFYITGKNQRRQQSKSAEI